VLPKDRHVIGKKHTTSIESDNSNVRHDMGRFTRKSKVVSQCEVMVDLTLRLWYAVTVGGLFEEFRGVFLDMFV
jgi:IS1 family transposase